MLLKLPARQGWHSLLLLAWASLVSQHSAGESLPMIGVAYLASFGCVNICRSSFAEVALEMWDCCRLCEQCFSSSSSSACAPILPVRGDSPRRGPNVAAARAACIDALAAICDGPAALMVLLHFKPSSAALAVTPHSVGQPPRSLIVYCRGGWGTIAMLAILPCSSESAPLVAMFPGAAEPPR